MTEPTLDLDEVGEEIAEERTVQADGKLYRFPGTLSVNRLRKFAPDVERLQKAADGGAGMDGMLDLIESVLKPLAGPDQTADILENVGIQKVQQMIVGLFGMYGLGEASDSNPSSPPTGTSSSPTSDASTNSDSTKSSGRTTRAGSSA